MYRAIAVAAAFAALLVLAGAALAAHNGNNRAELTGPGRVTGVVVVNYSEGQHVRAARQLPRPRTGRFAV